MTCRYGRLTPLQNTTPSEFTPNFRFAPTPVEFLPGTAVLMPNTIRTFRHRDGHMCAPGPCILVNHALNGLVLVVARQDGPMPVHAGLPLYRVERTASIIPSRAPGGYHQKLKIKQGRKAGQARHNELPPKPQSK